MKEFLKKNWQIVLVGFATLVLAVIALVTAWKLYQVGKEPIAPTAPISEPRADEDIPAATGAGEGEICGGLQGIACQPPLVCVYDEQTTTPPSEDATGVCATFEQELTEPCVLEFTVEASPSPSPSPSPSASPSPSPSASPEPSPSPSPTPSASPEPSPTPSPAPSPSPSPSPPPPGSPAPSPSPSPAPEVELPEAGFISPTILATLGGIILILIGLLL